MRRVAFVCLLGVAVWGGLSGCEDDIDTTGLANTELFRGMMVCVPDLESNPTIIYPDSTMVTFTVTGKYYALELDDPTHLRLCNTEGTVLDFTKSILQLIPTSFAAHCDSKRVPKGLFRAMHSQDSLYLGPTEVGYDFQALNGVHYYDTVTYEFRLKMQ